MKRGREWWMIMMAGLLMWGWPVWLVSPVVAANGDPASTSNNYRLDESELGSSGDINSGSTNFKFLPTTDDGGATLGDTATGNSASTNYQTNGGFNTTAQPSLTLIVNTNAIDLGVLSTLVASTAIATFSVKNYTSYGYVVQIVGTPPSNSGHQLAPMTTTSYGDASTAGVAEQFGLNLVANTSPVNAGADPVQVPSGPPTFGYGVAGNGNTGTYGTTRPYTVDGRYRFVSGETVASAPKSSGETDYTMTFLANMTNTTPGGKYTGNLDIVTTGTY